MITSNLTSNLVNGTLGNVIEFVSLKEAISSWSHEMERHLSRVSEGFKECRKSIPNQRFPKIQTDSGEVIVVPPILWEITNELGQTDGTILYLPLMLAYALTIHKVQGLTLTGKVVVDFTDLWKCHHIVYVALSRVRHPEQLIVRGLDGTKFDEYVSACPLALAYDRGLRDAASIDMSELTADTHAKN